MRLRASEARSEWATLRTAPILRGPVTWQIEIVMPEVRPFVFVVDDDISIRESLELLITNAGWTVETFVSAVDFLSRPRAHVPCCLVLDVTLPGLSGLELQQQLAERTETPIIF